MNNPSKKRIVIVGGGPAALTTAYWLTSSEALRARYAITIYQMGWRLGGKGASGRNRSKGNRIEEHGLHIMFGFYQNFFGMIRKVYQELGRPEQSPLSTWRKAFHPLTAGVMEDKFRGRWRPWIELFPRNREVPGNGGALNGPLDYLSMGAQSLLGTLIGWRSTLRLLERWFPTDTRWESAPDDVRPEPTWGSRLLFRALDTIAQLCAWLNHHVPIVSRLANGVYELFWWLVKPFVARYSGAHRFFTAVDCLVAVFRGVVVDRLFESNAYARIDALDFRDWLTARGAHETTRCSPYVRAIYDAAFSYADGKSTRQLISASVGLRTLARLTLSYKGAVYYKMQCGMGDTIIGPLYEVLKARGVEFRFFHKASALHLDPAGQKIERIDFEQQAELLCGDPARYQPLFDVNGLPCWPSEPLYNQIKDADHIQGIDLESYYSGYKGVRTTSLQADRDFDQLVLATPVQTLPLLCQDMPRWNDRWRRMTNEVKAVQTLSFQVWTTKTTMEMGWMGPQLPLLSLFVQPYNTWSDMSQVLPRESWPSGHAPASVQYFTGAQPGPDMPPPIDERTFPQQMTERARVLAVQFMEQNFTTLMPTAAAQVGQPSVDWRLLYAPDMQSQGPARFESQYWRSNCEPHERCTLALPGTGQYRIKAGDTGYANLVISGDWIDNGIHVACLEGAVMGGIYAARAVSGETFPIVGEMMNGSIFGLR